MPTTGDHKQLRPKVEQYSLRVESGRGFDLNVSLFERLAKSGYPHATLELQHRMPPEVRIEVSLRVGATDTKAIACHFYVPVNIPSVLLTRLKHTYV